MPPKDLPSYHPLWRYGKAFAILGAILASTLYLFSSAADVVRDPSPEEIREQLGADEALAAWPVEKTIAVVNRMTPDERREVLQSPEAERYFQQLAPEERVRFIQETMDKGIRQQIEKYREMDATEKAEFVQTMKQRQTEVREEWERLSPEDKEKLKSFAHSDNLDELLERAVKAYLAVTSSEERAQLQPLFEGALENLEYARNLK